MDHSIITQIPSEIIYITISDLNQIVPKENIEAYKKTLKKYPNNRELKQMYWEKRNWETYRKGLLKNIHLERENKMTWQK